MPFQSDHFACKISGVAFDRYRFGGEMGFDVVDQDSAHVQHLEARSAIQPSSADQFKQQLGRRESSQAKMHKANQAKKTKSRGNDKRSLLFLSGL